jgi:hypothetical protein
MKLGPEHLLSAVAILISLFSIIRSAWTQRQGTDEGLRAKFDAELKAVKQGMDVELKTLRQVIEAQEILARQWREQHHDKVIILETKLEPLLTTLSRRSAEMLHQPEPGAWESDQIHDKIRREGVEHLTDEEIDRQLRLLSQRMERLRQGSAEGDQLLALGAAIQIAILEGEERTRQLLRERDAQEAEELKQRQVLLDYLLREARLREAERQVPSRESWWRRFVKYLWQ